MTSSGGTHLNVGCGSDAREGFVNIDSADLPGVDLVCDLGITPWPFEESSIASILAKDVLEHMPDLEGFLQEVHRILEPGGTLTVSAPHFTSRGAHVDPTHVRSFAFDTLDFFTSGHSRSYYWDFSFGERRSSRIVFDTTGPYVWNRLLERIANQNDRTRRVYESTPIRVFPALNVLVTLVK